MYNQGMENPQVIYESPDGGETVYRRELGSAPETRQLHSISQKKKSLIGEMRESKFWGEVHRAAQTDPELARLLDQVRIYYTLRHKNTT